MIKLKIGKAVRASVPPVDTYEIVVTGMSGDGDHYEESSQFGNYDSTMKYLQLLNAVCAMDWNTRCDESPIWPVLEAKGAELGMEEGSAGEWYCDMVGSDITCEDRYAMLDSVEVFWYDAQGQKFEVEVSGMENPH